MNDILETGKSTSLADNQVHPTFINKFGKIALETQPAETEQEIQQNKRINSMLQT